MRHKHQARRNPRYRKSEQSWQISNRQDPLGVRIVVTTHSPYFFQALRIFSDEEEMSEDVAFYGSTTVEDGSVRFDELDRAGYLSLVDRMAKPFEELAEVEIKNMVSGKGEIMVGDDEWDDENDIDDKASGMLSEEEEG